MVYTTEKMLKDYGEALKEDDRKNITDKLEDAEKSPRRLGQGRPQESRRAG